MRQYRVEGLKVYGFREIEIYFDEDILGTNFWKIQMQRKMVHFDLKRGYYRRPSTEILELEPTGLSNLMKGQLRGVNSKRRPGT